MRNLRRTALALVVALAVGVPPAQASNPDLTVYRVRTLVDGQQATTVPDQYPVIFKAFARNLGPGTSDMYVTYTGTRNLFVQHETCVVTASETGDFSSVSADTPSCEWSDVPEGDYAMVRVRGYAVGEPGQHVRITFCSSNGQSFDDGDPTNDCQTARLTISG